MSPERQFVMLGGASPACVGDACLAAGPEPRPEAEQASTTTDAERPAHRLW